MRLVGVSVSALQPEPEGEQIDLFDTEARTEQLNQALDRVRDRLGEVAVIPAATLRQRRRSSHVPFGAISSLTRPQTD